MARNHFERMKAIDDYFASISPEELEEKLIEAGAGRIKSSHEFGYKLESNCYNCSSIFYLDKENEHINEFGVSNINKGLGAIA